MPENERILEPSFRCYKLLVFEWISFIKKLSSKFDRQNLLL